jgi:glycine dehydrogenase
MVGMDVVVVGSDAHGNVDLDDLKAKIAKAGARLAA